jgi:hypothetical protein
MWVVNMSVNVDGACAFNVSANVGITGRDGLT